MVENLILDFKPHNKNAEIPRVSLRVKDIYSYRFCSEMKCARTLFLKSQCQLTRTMYAFLYMKYYI